MSIKVYLLDDDSFFASTFKELLEDVGIICDKFPSVEAFELSMPKLEQPEFMVVDLAIPLGDTKLIDLVDARGGHEAGIALIRKIRHKWADCKYVLLTGGASIDAKQWCEGNNVQYHLKPIDRQKIEQIFGLRERRAFVVHGRNLDALNKIKTVLDNIHIEPVVLFERPNKGRTVIEKFEEVSGECDCAVVIMTPDDLGGLAGEDPTKAKNRVRQNVIFELGYFCGSLGRRSGKVVLVEFGELEIPSDLAGVIRVDGTKSVKDLASVFHVEFEG